MKRNGLTVSSLQLDPTTEAYVRSKDIDIKTLVERNAKHFAGLRPAQPLALGDNLEHYTGEPKASYEQLHAEMRRRLQPSANFPEAKIDQDRFRERDATLDATIKELIDQNHCDTTEAGGPHTNAVDQRIRVVVGSTLIILIGETLYNTKSFQVLGDALLFAFVLSLALSLAVFFFSHIVPMVYKTCKTRLQRIGVIVGSLLVTSILFTGVAMLRTTYLESHDVHISPLYFVLINLFFFIVSALISFFVMPNREEIKESAHRFKLHRDIKKRTKRIEQLKHEKQELYDAHAQRNKERLRIVLLSNHYGEVIRKMYEESIALFKRVNLAHRGDGKVPDCFNAPMIETDIYDEEPIAVIQTRKLHENNFNHRLGVRCKCCRHGNRVSQLSNTAND